jgi:uncharacterized Zn finger protein
MAKERLPRLTEAQVRDLASGKSFERGEDYLRVGALLEPYRQGAELRAECEGTEAEPYRVGAVLDKNGVAETSCTCPYDWGGACKHVVALLLAYVRHPQTFRVVQPLEAMLAERTKEELVALIGEMVRREPVLMSVLELSEATRKAAGGAPLDAKVYRRQARRALRHDEPRAVEKELRSLGDAAARLSKAGNRQGAGVLYHALLDEAVRHYGDELQMLDEDGDIAVVVDELAQGLGQCLRESEADAAIRRAWLEALLSAELADIELGGIDLAPSARAALLECAGDAEWEWIEGRVRTEISRSRDWARAALVGLLAERRKRRGQAKDAAALVREMGTPEQKALLLAREGETDEALRRMRQIVAGKPGLAVQFAEALLEAGAKGAAVELTEERARGGDAWCDDWLAKYYCLYGSPQEALKWQRKVFLRQSSIEAFRTLCEVGRKLGRLEEVRADAFAALEREKKIDALVEIALDEGDVARALELLPRVGRHWEQDYRQEVAEAAEKDYPREALALYSEMAESAIDERQRSSYQKAVQHLKRSKALYKRLGLRNDWDAYLRELRARYANLPALQDELHKARL